MILWGENALIQYRIPAAVIRDDIAVPSDLLDDAAAALLANGWKVSPTKLPLPHTPDRCRSGWDIVAKYSRLFRYPESYGTRPHELLVLPASLVGLEHESLHDFLVSAIISIAFPLISWRYRSRGRIFEIRSKLPCLRH